MMAMLQNAGPADICPLEPTCIFLGKEVPSKVTSSEGGSRASEIPVGRMHWGSLRSILQARGRLQ
jgi:hypothetical protein